MSTGRALAKFKRVTAINSGGELVVPAGRYARSAIVCVFEMIGGLETFAQWAEDNQGEYYTKMFGKTIGREVEHKNVDDVEDILKILDLEAEEITDIEIIEDVIPRDEQPP